MTYNDLDPKHKVVTSKKNEKKEKIPRVLFVRY